MAPEQSIPNSLLIILHLHLLNYPLQDATGYDERLFDPSRGMRDRSKAMEDITYFLVGKIEGGKERAKGILPTYPCVQPSDSAPFRIALSKYFEAMRSAITHTTHSSGSKGKLAALSTIDQGSAWWWKDVVVRKSILDECSGDRFERLILALSSHAVLKNTTRVSSLSSSSAKGHEGDLAALSKRYTMRLVEAQRSRCQWECSAAVLLHRQLDSLNIRARLAKRGSSKYDPLSTDRLVALKDSRHQDLLRGSWKGEEGLAGLRLIMELAGLLDTPIARAANSSNEEAETGVEDLASLQTVDTPPPLPVAAARHPTRLHSLRQPLLLQAQSNRLYGEVTDDDLMSTSVPHAVSERLAAIERVHRTLYIALANAQTISRQLHHQRDKVKTSGASHAPSQKAKIDQVRLDVNLWDARSGTPIDFKKLPDADSLARFGLAPSLSENTIEDRIAHIRTGLLPPFTAAPLPASDSEPEPEPPVRQAHSRLPEPSSHNYTHSSRSAHRGGPHLDDRSAKSRLDSRAASIMQVRVAGESRPTRIPSGRQRAYEAANAKTRRLSRRASAARTRRSTMFGQGEDAEIFRIVRSVQDCSEDEDETESELSGQNALAGTPQPRTPAKNRITHGMLLSSVKKSGPRQSFDIEKYERVDVPRLPSIRLETALELDEDEEPLTKEPGYERTSIRVEAEDDDEAYEGHSMTLADILMQAGHQGGMSTQLLEEDELEDMSDWE
ncbi:hypothetical protein C8Q74DRAFT_535518 [Fomes fomentarius]|nr:hypothetical protein C8Q74DRAFT_535518 [Fomes fomentarius]